MTEREITAFQEYTEGMNRRDSFKEIKSLIEDDRRLIGRILVICGLRRTGKTTLMKQVLCGTSVKIENCIFLEVQDGDTMKDVDKRIEEEYRNGKTVIAIDGITKVCDFINVSAILADCFSKRGMKIIVTGADSLSIIFAEENELYDRTCSVNTTHISYAEHCRVLKTRGMDEYIEHGGIMNKCGDENAIEDYESVQKYLDDAVASNIANSLKNNTDISYRDSALKGLSRCELREAVEKAVGLYSGKVNKSIIKSGENAKEFAEIINDYEGMNVSVTPRMIEELEKWFKAIGFLSLLEEREYEKTTDGWKALGSVYAYHIVQPAIRYNCLKNMSFSDEEIKEDMIEQIALFDTMNALPENRYLVCRLKFNVPENIRYMLIYDKSENKYWCFEIKYTSEPFEENSKDKADIKAETQKATDYFYGDRENICVLYNGKSVTDTTGTEYYNISDFLFAVDEYRDMDKAMEQVKNCKG